MRPRRIVCFLVTLLGFVVAACGGGSGSSGFDAFPRGQTENAAITQARQEHRCVNRGGLEICPADQGQPTPSTTPIVFPTQSVAPTPTGRFTATIVVTRPTTTPTPNAAGTQPPATPTPTATPTPEEPPGVSTDLNPLTPISCVRLDAECAFTVSLVPHGFPSGTVYRIATRTLEPLGRWVIGPPFSAPAVSPSPVEASVSLMAAAPTPGKEAAVQVAVLVFLNPEAAPASEVDQLADTGASYAFVTDQLIIVAE